MGIPCAPPWPFRIWVSFPRVSFGNRFPGKIFEGSLGVTYWAPDGAFSVWGWPYQQEFWVQYLLGPLKGGFFKGGNYKPFWGIFSEENLIPPERVCV